MRTVPATRPLWILLAAVGPGVLACGKPPPPLPADPPRVQLVPIASTVADTQLEVSVTVSGCDGVRELSLWNRDVHVTNAPYAGNPTKVEIQPNQLTEQYHAGLAADLALVARVTCEDDRRGASSPVGVRFLPVAEVIRPTNGSTQVVTDVFWAEGHGAQVGFLGCSGSVQSGQAFVRVKRDGEVTAFNTLLPFPCSTRMRVTDRHLATGKRWAVEPGVGAFAFHTGTLNITASFTGNVSYLSVGPDGDALVYTAGGGGEAIRRLAHDGSGWRWAQPFQPSGVVMGNPVVDPSLGFYVAVYADQIGQYQGTVGVERGDYATGARLGQRFDMRAISYGLGDAPPIPPASFSADGTTVYFPLQTPSGATSVIACATNASDCMGTGSLVWQSANLPGSVLVTQPFHAHSMLAAVTPRYTWFLSAATGQLLNRDGTAVSPGGAGVTMGVQPGHGKDFYLLNGSGQPGSLPNELIAVDDPAEGPLFRYSLNGGHMMAGVDEGGQLWLRIGPDLVRPLPLTEYQLVVHR